MPPQFGTSGLRGLVVDLTPDLVADHVRAFAAACPMGTGLFVARDLRPSSPAIADMVIAAARACGLDVTDCGDVPTPALALAAMGAGAAAIMVTGSHIPADRNGLKFYVPHGEIGKADEVAILANLGRTPGQGTGSLHTDTTAGAAYVARTLDAYGPALAGRRIGVYSHSAVGRDLLLAIVAGLGADVVELGRSATFIPVDTEAVDPAVRDQLTVWAKTHTLDAIVSTDGDGDRPLLADAHGRVVPGDVLGQITGTALGADVAVTPVSSNTGAEALFARVRRTRIGSPFVIAGMAEEGGRVVGYEANGGFLLGFDAQGPVGPLSALATRDAVLPLVAPLVAAFDQDGPGGLAALVAGQPARFTATDRLVGVPTATSQALVAQFDADAAARAAFLVACDGTEAGVDRTDGLRITLTDGRIVHLRPSGNAPELRFYAEAATEAAAQATLAAGLAALAQALV
ncbi:phosphomannomutase [Loktanella fryxellensis]|uniref:Phosphomannomutase n=1 Tax=Loktanella fryxellensis TaxID=245187 RepID=A0A1H8GVZ5_9RHOB|nr:phosphomannomutase [Loktanella fryxellensis]SEN47647.1 phosphomannomutase [Loktanella fryxellensis]